MGSKKEFESCPLKTQWLFSLDNFLLLTHTHHHEGCLSISTTEAYFLNYAAIGKEPRLLQVNISPLYWSEESGICTSVSSKPKQKPFWFPSCKLKSNASMLCLSLERIHLILISFLSVCFGDFHIYCWNGLELGSEKAAMWCISRQPPSAGLGRLSVEAEAQLHCPGRGQKTGWETKARHSIFDHDVAEMMAHLMFQVNGVPHDITFPRTRHQSGWKRSENSGFATVLFSLH